MEQIKVLGVLVPLFLALALPPAAAQTIPTPVDDTVDQLEETAGQVVETVEDAAGGAGQTVQETTGGATGGATGGTGGATGSVTEAAGGATGSTGTTSGVSVGGTGDGGGSVASVTGSSGSGSSTERSGAPTRGEAERRGEGARGDKAGAKSASGRATVQPAAPARPAALAEGVAGAPIVLLKMNDADGDGSFSRVEIAAEPRADVPFRIVVRNVGSGPATIIGLSDYLPGGGEVSVRRDVCPELAGTTIDPGGSVTCAFQLPGYSPPEGEVKVNTAAANVVLDDGMTAGGTARSLYATSTVQTGPPAVLGLILPDPGALARTGASLLPLLAAAVLLAALGGELLRLGRQIGFDRPGELRYR